MENPNSEFSFSSELQPTFTLRPSQRVAALSIEEALKENKFVFLEAPTGAGKTIIGQTVLEDVSTLSEHGIYTCHTKGLQQQYLTDFPHIPVMYGRSNYPTEHDPSKTALDCEGTGCQYCTVCPYKVAKATFLDATIAMTNLSYLMAEINYVGRAQPYLIVIDEADLLEKVLLDFVSLNIPEYVLTNRYHLNTPSKKTVMSAWVEWAEYASEHMQRHLGSLKTMVRNGGFVDEKELEDVHTIVQKLKVLLDPEIGLATDNWVYDGYSSKSNRFLSFKPIIAAPFAEHYLWRHAEKFVLMSATPISHSAIAQALGIPQYSEIRLPSIFPPERRPIRIVPTAKMSAKSTPEDYEKMARQIIEILDIHQGRVLIHTVSYALADRLRLLVGTPRAVADLDEYLRFPSAVFFTPSINRGVSLAYDDCEAIIIPKLPYMSLGDKQVSARLYSPGGQVWYSVHTIRELVQMTGRGMRYADDWCTSYILDGNFLNLWNRQKHLFPVWWRDAVKRGM